MYMPYAHKIARLGIDGFLIALICTIGFAYICPWPGMAAGFFSLKTLAHYGVAIIFFFYGLKLSPEKLRLGLGNWRLHLMVQSFTFILFPLTGWLMVALFATPDTQLLWMGIFYLSALPSTVSSSVVMVSIAKGNIPAAIFNASISSLLGIVLTPLWMGIFLKDVHMSSLDMNGIVLQLAGQVLIPVILGLWLHRYWGSWAEDHKSKLKYFDQLIILIIVYISFCESFLKEVFSGLGLVTLFYLAVGVIVFFFSVYLLMKLLCNWIGFNEEDTITATFCGSKKSLVHGTVMSKVLFPGSEMLGIILLPLMLYHAFQLLIVSSIAQMKSKREKIVIS